eukprot:11907322-Heterocapsa_arctica.AAC.1
MEYENQNNSPNNKRAKTSDNSQQGVGQYSFLNFLSKRKTKANVHIQEPQQKKSKAKQSTDSSSSQAVGKI